MKVILSRKGFDSNTGGISSAIFENGDLISFPIPEHVVDGVKEDHFNMLKYKDLDLSRILNNLGYQNNQKCHIDPDIIHDRRKEAIQDWEAIFGQCDQAASYLTKTLKVKKGDIFLFFGNFHFVENVNGVYRRTKKTGNFYKDNDLQLIWGYLQVGEIITNEAEQKKYYWHPHAMKYYTEKTHNVMFVASEKLSFNKDIPGYGLLKYRTDRVLTKENFSKANWKINPVYDVDSIYGNRKNSANNHERTIYYRGQWQELGLKESKECQDWVKKIIEE